MNECFLKHSAKLTAKADLTLQTRGRGSGPEDKLWIAWDDKLTGFGVRVRPSGRKVYFVKYRHEGRAVKATIGPHGPITPAAARARAAEIVTLARTGRDLEGKAPRSKAGGELRLPDSKTGARIVHLGVSAIEVLRGIQRKEDRPWVIPALKRVAHLAFLHGPWRLLLERAGIKEPAHSRPAAQLRQRGPTGRRGPAHDREAGKLLGHNRVQTTARYAHLANDPLKSAANRIASRLAEVAG